MNMSDEKKVCVLMGGTSEEREISLKTGRNVFRALEETEYEPYKCVLDRPDDIMVVLEKKDLVFNCLHGGIGEDGTLQTLFEIMEVPYTGTGPLGSVTAMNKLLAKQVFSEESLSYPRYLSAGNEEREKFLDRVERELGFPAVVKPVEGGSSLGVSLVGDREELKDSLPSAKEYGDFFVEEYISGREVTAGVLRTGDDLRALPLVELKVLSEPFYTYKAKYTSGETDFLLPAPLEEDVYAEVEEKAKKVHRSLGCRGYSRIDFIVGENQTYVMEANTLPGMTRTSNLSKAAGEEGMSFEELAECMLRSAIDRRKNYKEE